MAWKNADLMAQPVPPAALAGGGGAAQGHLRRQTLESKDGNLGVGEEHRRRVQITGRRRCGLLPRDKALSSINCD